MKKVLVSLLVLFPMFSYASSQQVNVGRTIVNISGYENFVFVQFSPSFEFTQGCDNSDGISVAIDTSNDKGRGLLSLALSAAAQKLDVGFGVNGCNNGRPLIYRIDVNYHN